jgi:FixJ family two-component response regulator
VADGTVFVVDDDQAVRQSLDLLIKSVGLPVCTFASAQEFLDRFDPAQPGCLVLDVRMPGMSGLELQRQLKERGIDIPVIIVTGHGDVPIAVRAMKDGALEFLEKPFSKQMLLEHIRDALQRDAVQRRARAKQVDISERLAALTEREREVMELVIAGKPSKLVAMELGISKKTVDVHRARVMQKLGVRSLPELVELALAARSRLQPAANGAARPHPECPMPP